MLLEIESLLVIQDRDQRILKLEEALKNIPLDKERAKQRLANDLQAVADAKKNVQENEMAIKSVELDIGTRKNTLDRLKVQQFETKKNEEYAAIGNEIKRYTQEVDDLETSELELMEKADALRLIQKEKEDALAITQSMVDEEIKDLEHRAAENNNQLEEVKSSRTALTASVDEELLSLYERLMKSKSGNAIVEEQNSQCTGCHMKLVPATVIQLQADKELTQCENCGRILYI
ncbi:MAG: zinc ribbon domain-containing protein [Akkermansiaceae bacterium]